MKKEREVIQTPYKDGFVNLIIPSIEDIDDIDVDKITKINEAYLLAEALTFPVLLNRIGLILAEAVSVVEKAELDLRIQKANIKKDLRTKLPDEGIKVTNDALDDYMRLDKRYKIFYMRSINAQKRRDQVNSIYWAAKDKSDNIKKLLEKIHPDELIIDSLVDEFNGIKIVVKENLIK